MMHPTLWQDFRSEIDTLYACEYLVVTIAFLVVEWCI